MPVEVAAGRLSFLGAKTRIRQLHLVSGDCVGRRECSVEAL